MKIIYAIAADKPSFDTENLWRSYDRVSYGEHLLRVMTFRDPYALYSPELRRAVGRE